jgi:hypothetical protein
MHDDGCHVAKCLSLPPPPPPPSTPFKEMDIGNKGNKTQMQMQMQMQMQQPSTSRGQQYVTYKPTFANSCEKTAHFLRTKKTKESPGYDWTVAAPDAMELMADGKKSTAAVAKSNVCQGERVEQRLFKGRQGSSLF